jgi:L-ascorbate metabolism protein UlaG (beta-lactamase superfamily)
MYKAKINYLYHSSFIMETNSHIFIFDYYNDNSNGQDRSLNNGVISDEILKSDKSIYVFASHGHGDHFNPLIFEWKKINHNIKYILSSDIEIKENYPEHNLISEGESIEFEDIVVKAYGSTDIGVSFMINADGMNIFHAGDLNWWHWYDETDEFNTNMAKDFKYQIDKLKDNDIDIAFFPVDYRLEENYYLGGEYFIENLSPKLFIPMHFGDHPEITNDFSQKQKGSKTKIEVINERGQEILY